MPIMIPSNPYDVALRDKESSMRVVSDILSTPKRRTIAVVASLTMYNGAL